MSFERHTHQRCSVHPIVTPPKGGLILDGIAEDCPHCGEQTMPLAKPESPGDVDGPRVCAACGYTWTDEDEGAAHRDVMWDRWEAKDRKS